MQDRVGTLDLNWRLAAGRAAPASLPGLERTLRAGLGEALGRRLAELRGDGNEVIVIREVEASVALTGVDAALDAHVLDRVGRAAADAVVDLLARDTTPDAVMRFVDQTAFVGAFIADLLDGTAWQRWYFGAFEPLRGVDDAGTLRAVLADCGGGAARVLGWLSRHGRLAAVLASITPREARVLATGWHRAPDRSADGSDALIAAARRLLVAIDARFGEALDARPLSALSTADVAPDWSGHGTSVRVLEWMQRLAGDRTLPVIAAQSPSASAVRTLLAGPLDWLDGRWLASRLIAADADASATLADTAPRRRLLTPRQERSLARVSAALRGAPPGALSRADEDECVVRLLAWAIDADDASDAWRDGPDRSVVAVIEHAVHAARASSTHHGGPAAPAVRDAASPTDTATTRPITVPDAPDLPARIAALRSAGPAALQLLRDLHDVLRGDASTGVPTRAAGLFLLVRAIADARLMALATRVGIARGPLLDALSTKWLGEPIAPESVAALWRGDVPSEEASEDPTEDPSEAAPDPGALRDLNALLTQLLTDRGAWGPDAEARLGDDSAAFVPLDDLSPETDRQLARTAVLLLRGWAHWLPGFATAGVAFVLDRCIRRAGRVRVDGDRLQVRLEPASLDLVLRMAGYLAAFDGATWLGPRSITFDIVAAGGSP